MKSTVEFRLIVGAPKGNITDGSSSAAIRKLVEPGVVYQCPFDSQLNNCAAIIVDSDGMCVILLTLAIFKFYLIFK